MLTSSQENPGNSKIDEALNLVTEKTDFFSRLMDEASKEEKQEILKQIDEAVSKKRFSGELNTLVLKPRKKGLLLPVFINTGAMLLITVVVVISVSVFRFRQQQIALETSQYYSTEGKILETFQREAEQKLKQKDAAILRILGRLSDLDQKQQEMERITEISIREKEKELQKALAAELESERKKLAASSISEEEIKKTLQSMEEIKNAEKAKALTEYKSKAEAALQRREQELVSERDFAEAGLEKASMDSQMLLMDIRQKEEELGKRQVELESEVRRKILSAEAKVVASDREIERLRRELLASSRAGSAGSDQFERERAVRQGREAALEDVVRVIEDVKRSSAGTAEKPAEKIPYSEVETDALPENVVSAIRSLTETGPDRIIGTVSLVSQDQIVIEKLTEAEVRIGANAEVRRVSGSGVLIPIAGCTISQVSGDRIMARVDRIYSKGFGPDIMDRIYIKR